MSILEPLAAHLAARGVTAPITGNRQPRNRQKDLVVTLTEMPGGRSECEDLIDQTYVEVRVRGEAHDMVSGMSVLEQIDRIMTDDSLWPFDLGGRWCIQSKRNGGPPAFLHHDHESRATHRCTYRLLVGR